MRERWPLSWSDPAIGDFGVDVAIDEEQPQLVKRIARFFANRHPDDLLFVHFSGHGVRDIHGDLYLAATDTEFDLLSATAISASWLNEQFSRTRSRRTVVLLDCCFSGSFPFGARARAGADVNVRYPVRGGRPRTLDRVTIQLDSLRSGPTATA